MIFAGGQIIDEGFIFDDRIVGPWMATRIDGMTYVPGSSAAIARVHKGGIVAATLYENFNGTNVSAHIAVDKGGMNRRFLWLIFDYPFNRLGVNRITGVVASSNMAARRLDEHLGFELEATLKDAHPDGDLLVYKMTRTMCRWIKELHHGKE